MLTAVKIMDAHGLKVFDVDEISTHGGSVRVYACRKESTKYNIAPIVQALIDEEKSAGLATLEGYRDFAARVKQIKLSLMDFLLNAGARGQVSSGLTERPARARHCCIIAG